MKHISHELKSVVAQNCFGYSSRNPWGSENLAENCNSCSNYVRGKCVKGLFDDIASIISIN